MNPSIRQALRRLAAHARCHFLDHRSVAKRTVYNLKDEMLPKLPQQRNSFLVSTCLRLEFYDFNPVEAPSRTIPEFSAVAGKLAVRRLISLLAGMHSEIIGETEIFQQACDGIRRSLEANLFDRSVFWDLVEAIKYSAYLRGRHNLQCSENYSSVGAEMFNELMAGSPGIVAIIGSGYMAEHFMKAIRLQDARKIYWINRNVAKAKELEKSFAFLPRQTIHHVDLKDCREQLRECDFIFAAAANAGDVLAGQVFKHAKAIVDVSYPSLFSDYANPNLHSISNTYFEKYLRAPVEKSDMLHAEHELDQMLWTLTN